MGVFNGGQIKWFRGWFDGVGRRKKGGQKMSSSKVYSIFFPSTPPPFHDSPVDLRL